MHRCTHAPIAHIYIPREDILYETLALGFSYTLTDSLTQSQKLAYIYTKAMWKVLSINDFTSWAWERSCTCMRVKQQGNVIHESEATANIYYWQRNHFPFMEVRRRKLSCMCTVYLGGGRTHLLLHGVIIVLHLGSFITRRLVLQSDYFRLSQDSHICRNLKRSKDSYNHIKALPIF